MAIWWSNYLFSPENPPERLLSPSEAMLEHELPLLQGNSLFSVSELPPFIHTQVLATKVGAVEKYEGNYCDWDYQKRFWPEGLLDTATKICYCESQGDPSRINNSLYGIKEYSVSLFQINLLAHDYDKEWVMKPDNNSRVAVDIYFNNGGWKNWYYCAKKVGALP